MDIINFSEALHRFHAKQLAMRSKFKDCVKSLNLKSWSRAALMNLRECLWIR